MPLAISTELLLGGVGSLGAAAAVYAYGAMSHGSQLFGRTLIAPARPGELALTFDDGPNPAWTPRLLDILERHNVKATFFLVGSYAATGGGAGSSDRRGRALDWQSFVEPSEHGGDGNEKDPRRTSADK